MWWIGFVIIIIITSIRLFIFFLVIIQCKRHVGYTYGDKFLSLYSLTDPVLIEFHFQHKCLSIKSPFVFQEPKKYNKSHIGNARGLWNDDSVCVNNKKGHKRMIHCFKAKNKRGKNPKMLWNASLMNKVIHGHTHACKHKHCPVLICFQ